MSYPFTFVVTERDPNSFVFQKIALPMAKQVLEGNIYILGRMITASDFVAICCTEEKRERSFRISIYINSNYALHFEAIMRC